MDVFGHGISSYFKTLEYLIKLLTIVTILFIPVMYKYYTTYDGFAGVDIPRSQKLMIGNLGQRKSMCKHYLLGYHEIKNDLTCNVGTISNLYSVGILPINHSLGDFCGLPNDNLFVKQCSHFLDIEKVR